MIDITKRQQFGDHGFMMEYSDDHREYFIDHEWIQSKETAIHSEFLQLLCPEMVDDMIVYLVYNS